MPYLLNIPGMLKDQKNVDFFIRAATLYYSSQDASVLSEYTENCGDVSVVGPCCKSQLVDETGL